MIILLGVALLFCAWVVRTGMKESWQKGFKEGFEKGLDQKVGTLEKTDQA